MASSARRLHKLANINGEMAHLWFTASVTQNNEKVIRLVESDLITQGWRPVEERPRAKHIKRIREVRNNGK